MSNSGFGTPPTIPSQFQIYKCVGVLVWAAPRIKILYTAPMWRIPSGSFGSQKYGWAAWASLWCSPCLLSFGHGARGGYSTAFVVYGKGTATFPHSPPMRGRWFKPRNTAGSWTSSPPYCYGRLSASDLISDRVCNRNFNAFSSIFLTSA
jgi:hypothetical protein